MPIFNYKAKEMIVKVVYYGPGLCGKTTSLQVLHQKTIPERKGELYFLATETDQTIYFELLPLHVGEIRDFKLRFQVYTVPGQVKYNNTRKAVLQGVDAIVFVADSQRSRQEANLISFKNLQYNLKGGYNLLLRDIPLIYEYNKRDMDDLLTIDDLNCDLNPWHLPHFETVAIKGLGVLDAFETISSLTIQNLEKRFLREESSGWEEDSSQPAQKFNFFEHEEEDELESDTNYGFSDNNVSAPFEESGADLLDTGRPILTDEEPVIPEHEEPPVDILHRAPMTDEPLFPGTKHKELTYTNFMALNYHNEDIIFEEGEPGNEMFFIEEGQVKIIGSYKQTRKVVMTYSKGDFFGEMALFGGKTRSARAVAVGRTRLLPITKETLSLQIRNKPEIAMALLEALSGRIRHNTKTISKLAGQNRELMEHLKKARNVMQQFKEQNEFLRQKLDLSRK